MSGRTRVTLADGRRVTGFRKTLRQNPRQQEPDAALPFTLRFELPAMIAATVAQGDTAFPGVKVLPLNWVEATGHGLEWVCKQAAAFYGSLGDQMNREIAFTVERGSFRFSHHFNYVPGPSVVFPRRLKKALVFPVQA